MVIIVVSLDSIAMDAKSDTPASGLSGSSVVPDSTSGSPWPHNLSINAIWLNDSNYAQWTKSVEVYFIAKKQYKFLIDNPPIARRLMKRNMRIGQLTIDRFASFCETIWTPRSMGACYS